MSAVKVHVRAILNASLPVLRRFVGIVGVGTVLESASSLQYQKGV